jgi:hypothetical protein
LFPSQSRSLSYCTVCPPHPRHRHGHGHRQDRSFDRSVLWNLPSSDQHHPCQLLHSNSVVKGPRSHLAATASSLTAQFVPWDHHYPTKRNARQCIQHIPCSLCVDWTD